MKYYMKYIIILVLVLCLILLKFCEHSKCMNIFEMIEYNYKLILINNAGITDLSKWGSYILSNITYDPLLIKFHRKIQEKYTKPLIQTYIITKGKNYYIIDPKLSKQILLDSPYIFDAGKMKESFFKKIMPMNVGISPCSETKCPWKKRRVFNENVLSTTKPNYFLKYIPTIINNNIQNPPLNINDFKNISYKIVAESLYGDNNNDQILKSFTKKIDDTNFLQSKYYSEYKQNLQDYKNISSCPMMRLKTLLYYSNQFKDDKTSIIDDQIPHWFGPFIFIINYLIPNLLCIILNFKNINGKLMDEINRSDFSIYKTNTYLHYCVIEHIRLFNTININIQRSVKKDMTYNGIQLKKDDQIFILFSSILRNKDEFQKPDHFIPERWENKSIKDQEIVFGIGPQQCPSKTITPIYYKSILYELLSKFSYKDVYPKLDNKELYFINPYEIRFSI